MKFQIKSHLLHRWESHYIELRAIESEFIKRITELCNISDGQGIHKTIPSRSLLLTEWNQMTKTPVQMPLELGQVWCHDPLPARPFPPSSRGSPCSGWRTFSWTPPWAPPGAISFHFLVSCCCREQISTSPPPSPHDGVLFHPSFHQSEETFVKFHMVCGCLTLCPI